MSRPDICIRSACLHHPGDECFQIAICLISDGASKDDMSEAATVSPGPRAKLDRKVEYLYDTVLQENEFLQVVFY